MYTYFVEYSEDNGKSLNVMLVCAKDYTDAYTKAVFDLPLGTIIADVFKL